MMPDLVRRLRSCWLVNAVLLLLILFPKVIFADGPAFLESCADPSSSKDIVAVFDSASKGIYLLRTRDDGGT